MNEQAANERLALGIPELCTGAGISVRHFYELQRRGEGPPRCEAGTAPSRAT